MSFEIKLQNTTSPKNSLNKQLSDILTLTGTLREETSIIDPVIRIETSSNTIFSANYLTIPTFNRSYFITNIESFRNNIYNISAHVDVLSSFKQQILANNSITSRQRDSWNLYLNDGVIKTLQPSRIQLLKFPNGFTTNEFILAVAGG